MTEPMSDEELVCSEEYAALPQKVMGEPGKSFLTRACQEIRRLREESEENKQHALRLYEYLEEEQ
jgi:hypothetical protein